jgi:hypothetical protein
MFTLILNNISVNLPDNVTSVDCSNASELRINTNGSVVNELGKIKESDLFKSGDETPQYVSDTLPKLPYGNVAETVRETFTKVGIKSTIRAHTYSAIESAARNAEIRLSISKTENEFHWSVVRTS